jgi:hypothetical protein
MTGEGQGWTAGELQKGRAVGTYLAVSVSARGTALNRSRTVGARGCFPFMRLNSDALVCAACCFGPVTLTGLGMGPPTCAAARTSRVHITQTDLPVKRCI